MGDGERVNASRTTTGHGYRDCRVPAGPVVPDDAAGGDRWQRIHEIARNIGRVGCRAIPADRASGAPAESTSLDTEKSAAERTRATGATALAGAGAGSRLSTRIALDQAPRSNMLCPALGS